MNASKNIPSIEPRPQNRYRERQDRGARFDLMSHNQTRMRANALMLFNGKRCEPAYTRHIHWLIHLSGILACELAAEAALHGMQLAV